MTHFALIVTVMVFPGTAEDFGAPVLDNARAGRRDEPDCHRFDVLVSEDDADPLFFYEEYTEAGSLDAHRETPHYKKFRDATDHMVAERSIERCSVLSG
ncbi:MAG: putative quinol monooxygenase [Alphaproteobacteria bacterium]|nr:putative quinol monooxygenase [Alphaproteobacteria bacterium]